MFAQLKKDTHTPAIVVDGKLILSFPNALTPIVWQMDLVDAKSSSFEVVSEGDSFHLATKKQGGQKKDVIAPFATKEDAVSALMATSQALASAHGQIRQNIGAESGYALSGAPAMTHAVLPPVYGASQAPQKRGGFIKFIIAILVILVLLGLFSAMLSMRPRAPSSVDNAASLSRSNAQSQTSANPASSAGVPVSADDFLRAQ